MKRYILGLSLVLTFMSCGGEEEGLGNINIKLKYNDEPLVLFEEVDYSDGLKIEFTRISFYMSEIAASNENLIDKSDLAYYIDLSISHSTLANSEKGYDFDRLIFENDDYENLEFTLGVNPEKNATVPQDYPSSNDLSKTGEYWSNWNSYVFVKLEGLIIKDEGETKEAFVLHLGSDAAMRTVNLMLPKKDDYFNLVIHVDKIFNRNGEIFDIEATPKIHTLALINEINTLMDNLEESFELVE